MFPTAVLSIEGRVTHELRTDGTYCVLLLTSVIMRLFERLVYIELSSICNDYIDLDQFAYREGHNSTMALIKCQHTWLKWLDGNADFVIIFSFDFSKAFDSVSHNILCSKLKQVNINPCNY